MSSQLRLQAADAALEILPKGTHLGGSPPLDDNPTLFRLDPAVHIQGTHAWKESCPKHCRSSALLAQSVAICPFGPVPGDTGHRKKNRWIRNSKGRTSLFFFQLPLRRLLNLVIDAFVAAYLKGSEELQDRKAELQAGSGRVGKRRSQGFPWGHTRFPWVFSFHLFGADSLNFVFFFLGMGAVVLQLCVVPPCDFSYFQEAQDFFVDQVTFRFQQSNKGGYAWEGRVCAKTCLLFGISLVPVLENRIGELEGALPQVLPSKRDEGPGKGTAL